VDGFLSNLVLRSVGTALNLLEKFHVEDSVRLFIYYMVVQTEVRA
jgi:hypothetical protein